MGERGFLVPSSVEPVQDVVGCGGCQIKVEKCCGGHLQQRFG